MGLDSRTTSTQQMDHERLRVYQLALAFHCTTMQLLPRRGAAVLRDQLERASLSIVLNIAEGAGRSAKKDKRRFYVIARGSTTECAAILDVLRLRALASPERCLEARTQAVRLMQMLSKISASSA